MGEPINLTKLAASENNVAYTIGGTTFKDIMLEYADPNKDGIIDVKSELTSVTKTLGEFDLFNDYDTNGDGTPDDNVLTLDETRAVNGTALRWAHNNLNRMVHNLGGEDKIEATLLSVLRKSVNDQSALAHKLNHWIVD